MKYLVLCYYDVRKFEAMDPERREAMIAECKARDLEFNATGKVDCVGSQSGPSAWRCIRGVKDGKPDAFEGPWVPGNTQVGAFFIVDAKDMDEAVAVAMKHPGPHVTQYVGGGLEIRACDFYLEPGRK